MVLLLPHQLRIKTFLVAEPSVHVVKRTKMQARREHLRGLTINFELRFEGFSKAGIGQADRPSYHIAILR